MWRCAAVALILVACGPFASRAGADSSAGGESPFAIRGIKGLWWKGIDNYRLALPWLAEHKLNFLMLCYTSFPASASDWRADYTPREIAQLADLARRADRLGVHLCLSFNPGIWSKPPLTYSSESDYQRALAKVKQVHAAGIRWFGLCLDDISRALEPADKQRFGTLQAAQVQFINRLWHDMQSLKPVPKLIFCPSAYTTEDAAQHEDYIKTIGEGIDPGVMMFWTGPTVCSPRINAADARRFAAWIKRKPFIWDNYPVNDMFPWRPLLAPVKNRSADLAPEVCGYMANPMKQWNASTIPLATLADYLNDPASYDPASAMQRAISAYPPDQQSSIRALVDLYGSSFLGEPAYPPQPRPRTREEAAHQLASYKLVRDLLGKSPELKSLRDDVRPTLEADIGALERKARDRMKASPLKAAGDDFTGGAGDLFGFDKYGHNVNYVYARSTGRDTMQVEMWLDSVPPNGATLKLTARDDDSGRKLRIRVLINEYALTEGDSPFTSEAFRTLSFPVPSGCLKLGRNLLTVANVEQSGPLGNPPWFMVAEAELKIEH